MGTSPAGGERLAHADGPQVGDDQSVTRVIEPGWTVEARRSMMSQSRYNSASFEITRELRALLYVDGKPVEDLMNDWMEPDRKTVTGTQVVAKYMQRHPTAQRACMVMLHSASDKDPTSPLEGRHTVEPAGKLIQPSTGKPPRSNPYLDSHGPPGLAAVDAVTLALDHGITMNCFFRQRKDAQGHYQNVSYADFRAALTSPEGKGDFTFNSPFETPGVSQALQIQDGKMSPAVNAGARVRETDSSLFSRTPVPGDNGPGRARETEGN